MLIWNEYRYGAGLELWDVVLGRIIRGECGHKEEESCRFTTNRSAIGEADAVLFHLPPLHWTNYSLPEIGSRRNPEQLWILMNYEAGANLMRR